MSIFFAARALLGSFFLSGHLGGAHANGALFSRDLTSLTKDLLSLLLLVLDLYCKVVILSLEEGTPEILDIKI